MFSRIATGGLMVALMTATACPVAAQSVSTITLNGRVTAGTCAPNNPTVELDDISAKDMTATGRIDGSRKPVTITLSGCSGVTSADLVFGSAADADGDVATAFKNKAATAAPHTALWLGHTSCTDAGNDVAPGTKRSYNVTGGSLSVPLCAAYYKKNTGAVMAGDVKATFNVSITYH